jgi:VanZ family protein
MNKFLFWIPALGWMALIFYISHQPAVPIPPAFPHQDKVFHFAAYFLLGSFYCIGLQKMRLPFTLGFLFAALYGFSDEFHQSFVPGRDVSLLDWIADLFGAGVAIYVFPFLLKFFRVSLFDQYHFKK